MNSHAFNTLRRQERWISHAWIRRFGLVVLGAVMSAVPMCAQTIAKGDQRTIGAF
jgi:hypothetical protein